MVLCTGMGVRERPTGLGMEMCVGLIVGFECLTRRRWGIERKTRDCRENSVLPRWGGSQGLRGRLEGPPTGSDDRDTKIDEERSMYFIRCKVQDITVISVCRTKYIGREFSRATRKGGLGRRICEVLLILVKIPGILFKF